ncbi:hypothetical protein [Rhizobium sp. IBUN]|uniref:hypothetical protein n=1 Tax=Rhizobium sp. IBUN TaxID=1042326 RepID=UPI0004181A91|nr:hypothetical protein [Rhizobium sp. IBUN]
MDIVRDILDEQLIDRNGVKMGKVDGILAELRPGKPPRIVAIEIGAIVLARRVGLRPGQWLASLLGQPHRIPWHEVRDVGLNIQCHFDVRETSILDWQTWLRDHFITRIPGA